MTPIWDKIIEGAFDLERRGEVPCAVVLTEGQWASVKLEWRFGFSSGLVRKGERRIKGICVALVDDSYTGPVVLGSRKKD